MGRGKTGNTVRVIEEGSLKSEREMEGDKVREAKGGRPEREG